MEANKKKVLLVDDEASMLKVIAKSLERDRDLYDVLLAKNVDEALEILGKEKNTSIIVTDIQMPGMTGLDLYEIVSEEYPDILVIMMTGFKTESVLKEVQASGCLHFIEKPFKYEHLRRLISEAVSRSDEGFVGTLKNIQLSDLIQMCCLSSENIDIHVRKEKKAGVIYIKQGEIVHAICDDAEGEKAFFGILGWKGGRFETQPPKPVPKGTISKGWQYLLMEGARKTDEMNQKKEATDEIDQGTGAKENGKIRVMVVDDSPMMCRIITETLGTDNQIEIVGVARNGEEALEKLDELKPDLITLDANMPIMDGNKTLKYIMIKDPCPVSIISNMGVDSQRNILDFLRLGAVDFISKSTIKNDPKSQQRLVERVKLAASIKISKFKRFREPELITKESTILRKGDTCQKIVVVNSGVGGYAEIIHLISKIPDNVRTCTLVFQTMPTELQYPLAKYLDQRSRASVRALENGVQIMEGFCYIGVTGQPVGISKDNGCYYVRIEKEMAGAGIDQLYMDAAEHFNERVHAALLSGAEVGALTGLKSIDQHHGKIFIQKLNSCMVTHPLERVMKSELDAQEYETKDIIEKLFQ